MDTQAVADKLEVTLGKYGLSRFGSKGELFDPMQHEALMHAPWPTGDDSLARLLRHLPTGRAWPDVESWLPRVVGAARILFRGRQRDSAAHEGRAAAV